MQRMRLKSLSKTYDLSLGNSRVKDDKQTMVKEFMMVSAYLMDEDFNSLGSEKLLEYKQNAGRYYGTG